VITSEILKKYFTTQKTNFPDSQPSKIYDVITSKCFL
jgi:hypothetical protein